MPQSLGSEVDDRALTPTNAATLVGVTERATGAHVLAVDYHKSRTSRRDWSIACIRLGADGPAEIDEVDLSTPGQARASHSVRSETYRSHCSGSSRKRW
jgi:hypothetical protein